MLNIPESVKTLFKTDGTRKNFRVHFPNGELSDITNSAIVTESVHFTESLCSQSTFKFGLAERSVIEFETVGIGNMLGYQIECSYEIDTTSLSAAQIAEIQAGSYDGTLVLAAASDIGYGYYRVPLGVFTVDSCPRNKGAMTHRKVTGYGTFANASLSESFNLPEKGLYPEISIASEAILGMVTGDGLTLAGTAQFDAKSAGRPTHAIFHDETGQRIYIQIIDSKPNGETPVSYVAYPMFERMNLTNLYDFACVESFPDEDAYDELFSDVVEAFNQSGRDIRYDANGNQVYETNADALADKLMISLRPSILARFLFSNNSYIHTESQAPEFRPITKLATIGTLYPIVSMSTTRAFCIPQFSPSHALNKSCDITGLSIGCYAPVVSAEDHIIIDVGVNRTPSYQESYYVASREIQAPTIKLYNVQSISTRFDFTPESFAGSSAAYLSKTGSGAFSLLDTFNLFNFRNEGFVEESIGAIAELHGQSMKNDRLNDWDPIALSPTSPIAISAADTEDVWWDDYSISPVGTVAVKFSDGENDVEMDVSIGNGASVYDMVDNEILNNASGMTAASVTTLINGDFKDNVANIGFTPCEMTMQGWPWMEAGDALRITAEDGTIVNTYALRIEMSGIQNILATITADGGELMTEEG